MHTTMKRFISVLLMVLLTFGLSAQSKKTLSAQNTKQQTTASKSTGKSTAKSSTSKSSNSKQAPAKSTTSSKAPQKGAPAKTSKAADAADEEAVAEPDLRHMLGFSIQAGYGGLQMTKMDMLNKSLGMGAGLGFVYQMHYKAFLFQTGLEADGYLNQQTLKFPAAPVTFVAPDRAEASVNHYYEFNPYTETQLYSFVNVPIMLGAQANRFYFLVGAKLGVNPFSASRISATMNTWLNDANIAAPQIAYTSTQRNMPFKKVSTYNLFNCTLSGEIGLCLDKKVKAAPAKGKSKKNQKPAKATFAGPNHCYLSIFGDYGVLDNHHYTPNQVAYLDNGTEVAEGGLIDFSQVKNVGVADAAELNTVTPHTVTGAAPYKNSAIHNWMVGLKFTYVYDITKKTDNKDKDDEEKQKAKEAAKKAAQDKADKDADKKAGKDGGKNGGKNYDMDKVFAPDTIFIRDTVYITVVVHDTVARPGMAQGVRKYNFSNLFFALNQTKLLPQSRKSLGQLYSFLDANPAIKIRVVGHTDNTGTAAVNQRISEGRARNIRDYMIGLGIDPERVQSAGKGMSEPIVPNDTPEHMQQNRRVEIVILNPEVVPNLDEILTFVK